MKYSLIAFLLLSQAANAQFCETVTDSAWSARFDEMLQSTGTRHIAVSDTGIVDVAVIFHSQLQGGSPVVSEAQIDDALKTTNEYYFGAGIRFLRCGETRHYPEGGSPDLNTRAVNINIFRSASGCGYEAGGTVYINIACSRSLENILSHEIGHVLGLPHTHGPTNSGTTTELVDGSNCSTGGDKFCDTPADPNLNGKVDDDCRYTGTSRDLNGMEYHPLTNTVMSYTASHCADSLTPMQYARARAVALHAGFDCCEITPPMLRDTVACIGTSIVLTAITTAADVRWFDASKGGQLVGSGPLFVTPPITETRTWYAEAVDSCISARARVTVGVALIPELRTEGAVAVFDPDTARQSTMKILTADSAGAVIQVDDGALWYFDSRTVSGREIVEAPPAGKSLNSLLLWKNMLLYFLYDAVNGPSLHRVDLPSGTPTEVLVRDAGWNPSNFWFTAIDSAAIFFLNDGDYKTELWRTDGTATGTMLVKKFPYTEIFSPFGMTSVAGRAVFRADDFEHGPELWVTDGTAEGTRMISDIKPGLRGSDPGSFVESDGLVYFAADDGSSGAELWVTDFTHEGTHLVADMNPGAGGSSPIWIRSVNGLLFMSALNLNDGREPFVSDGTSEGTRLIADIMPGGSSFPQQFTALGERVFCLAEDGFSPQLWELLDKGMKGAKLVKKINRYLHSQITELAACASLLYFGGDDGEHGKELWCSDGSEEGTRMYADIDTASSSKPGGLTVLGGKLYFLASTRHGAALHTITADASTICSGQGARLIVVNSTGVARWYASESDGTPLNTGRVFDTPSLEESTVFWVELDDGVCVSPRRPMSVRVRASRPSITGPASVLIGSDVVLHASTASGRIEWHAKSDGTALLDTGSTMLLSTLKSDTTVYARSVEGFCSGAFVPHTISVHTGTGVSSRPDDAEFHLHPLPANDRLTIALGAPFIGELRVVDLLGRVVMHESVSIIDRHVVNIAQLRAGTYVLELTGNPWRKARIFVVTR